MLRLVLRLVRHTCLYNKRIASSVSATFALQDFPQLSPLHSATAIGTSQTIMEAARVGEGGNVTHNFFTNLAVDEALADPTASPLPMTMFDAIHEEEGDSEVTTQTPANHENEADSANEEQIDAGFNVLLLEGDITLPFVVSAADYLEFLEKIVLPSLLDARNQRQKNFLLLKLARDLKVLPPANPSILDLDFDISQWRHIIRELIKEMRIVESHCSLEVHNSGVYVLTSTPYNAFLEMLAAQLVD